MYKFMIFILLTSLWSSSATIIDCNFNTDSFRGKLYHCKVNGTFIINSRDDAIINSINGTHMSDKNNIDVIGFKAINKVIEFFPKNLEKFFKNLAYIWILNSGLKEIHQQDLKPFTGLELLDLDGNDIEILEADLFKYNQLIHDVSFGRNKLFHVDESNIHRISRIPFFRIGDGTIQYSKISSHRDDLVNALKVRYKSPKFKELDEKLKDIEEDMNFVTHEEFKDELEKFENDFRKSKFFNFLPLSKRFAELKSIELFVDTLHELIKAVEE